MGTFESAAKSVLVTGASRGIGLGIARRLASQGHSLTIAGRDGERLASVASELRDLGAADVAHVPGDVLDDQYLAALAASHDERYGRLDAVVLNAGAGSAGPIATFHPKRFDKQIATNLRASFVLFQNVLPLLRSTAADSVEGAKVVALASITGIVAEEDLFAYGAAKAGLIAMCRSINLEENRRGVTATAIAPGYVDTDMSGFKHGVLSPREMIRVNDVVEMVDACLRLSRWAVVSEIAVVRAGSAGASA